MVQIAGISLLDDLDHYCKERLHAKYYIRYMDDIFILHHDENELIEMLNSIKEQLAKIGFETHEKKTHIKPLSESFTFLGFEYKVTDTGKIIMTLNSKNVKHERKKLRHMVGKAKRGEMAKEKVDECYQSWCVHTSKGNSFKLLQRMDKYYKELWR